MTAKEMHTAVLLAIQQIGAFSLDDFQPEEIDVYLNRAQIRVLLSKIKEGEQDSSLLPEFDLRTIFTEAVLLPLLLRTDYPGGSPYEYLCPWPEDFLYFLNTEVGLTRTGNPTIAVKEYVPGIKISPADIEQVRVTTFNEPYLRQPRVIPLEDFLHVYVDNETTGIDQRLTYARVPTPILLHETNEFLNVDPELPEHTHDEIIEQAVTLITRDLNS